MIPVWLPTKIPLENSRLVQAAYFVITEIKNLTKLITSKVSTKSYVQKASQKNFKITSKDPVIVALNFHRYCGSTKLVKYNTVSIAYFVYPYFARFWISEITKSVAFSIHSGSRFQNFRQLMNKVFLVPFKNLFIFRILET